MKKFICIECGGRELNELENGIYVCNYCGLKFKDEDAVIENSILERLNEQEEKEYANAKKNLWDYTQKEYLSNEDIKKWCDEIKKHSPNDFFANFYYQATFNNSKDIIKYLNDYIENNDFSYVKTIVDYLIKTADDDVLIDKVIELVDIAELDSREELKTVLTKEKENINNGCYNVLLNRNVFVCYDENDIKKADDIVSFLEDNGLECFYAKRNLKKGRGFVENYNKNLNEALKNCNTILFISSSNSRRNYSTSDYSSVSYLLAKDYNKLNVEYVIDEDVYEETSNAQIQIIRKYFDEENKTSNKKVLIQKLKNIKATKKEFSLDSLLSDFVKECEGNYSRLNTSYFFVDNRINHSYDSKYEAIDRAKLISIKSIYGLMTLIRKIFNYFTKVINKPESFNITRGKNDNSLISLGYRKDDLNNRKTEFFNYLNTTITKISKYVDCNKFENDIIDEEALKKSVLVLNRSMKELAKTPQYNDIEKLFKTLSGIQKINEFCDKFKLPEKDYYEYIDDLIYLYGVLTGTSQITNESNHLVFIAASDMIISIIELIDNQLSSTNKIVNKYDLKKQYGQYYFDYNLLLETKGKGLDNYKECNESNFDVALVNNYGVESEMSVHIYFPQKLIEKLVQKYVVTYGIYSKDGAKKNVETDYVITKESNIVKKSYININIPARKNKEDYMEYCYDDALLKFELTDINDTNKKTELAYRFSFVFFEKTPIYYHINTLSRSKKGYRFNIEFEKFPKAGKYYNSKIRYNVIKNKTRIPVLDQDYVNNNKDNGAKFLIYKKGKNKDERLVIEQKFDNQVTQAYNTGDFKEFENEYFLEPNIKDYKKAPKIKVEDRIRLVFEDETFNNLFYLEHIGRSIHMKKYYFAQSVCPICGSKIKTFRHNGQTYTKCLSKSLKDKNGKKVSSEEDMKHIFSGDFSKKTISPMFLGGSNSGKTVFISSLCNINEDGNLEDTNELFFISNAFKKKVEKNSDSTIKRIKKCNNNLEEIDDSKTFKDNYSYSLGGNSFNKHTSENDILDIYNNPLMVNIGDFNLVLYDFPGEISSAKKQVKGNENNIDKFNKNFNVGRYEYKIDSIIALFDLEKNEFVNDSEIKIFFEVLKNIKGKLTRIKKDLPVAIVINKIDYRFDSTSKNNEFYKFEPNSNIGLFNVFRDIQDKQKVLDYIDEQSKEVESYLKSIGQFEKKEFNTLTDGLNIKYFSTSSICGNDFEVDKNDSGKVKLIHPKRSIKKELPLLWIMYEKGVI